MYIVVVGGGKVGYYLSKALLSEGHEVLVLEKDPDKCGVICDELGSVVVRGDGCEARTLKDVGTERADLLIAVTDEDEDNLVSCQVAKNKFHVPRTIARINNPKNESLFKRLGIDVTVSSTNLILEHIEEELPINPLVHLLTVGEGNIEIVEVKVPEDSPVIGSKIKEVELPHNTMVVLMIGKSGARVPTGETVIQEGDQVIAMTQPDQEAVFKAAFTGKK